MKPVYLEFDDIGLMLIGGASSSGKTNTARSFIMQSVLNGWETYVFDGHGKAASKDSLAAAAQELADKGYIHISKEPGEMEHMLRGLAQIAEAELAGFKQDRRKLIIIDEILPIMDRLEDKGNFVSILTKFATQYRKTGVKVIVLSQMWAKDFIGSAGMRRAANHMILHRMNADEAKLIISNSRIARSVSELAKGQAYVYTEGTYTKVSIDYISQDDLNYAAKLVDPVKLTIGVSDGDVSGNGSTEEKGAFQMTKHKEVDTGVRNGSAALEREENKVSPALLRYQEVYNMVRNKYSKRAVCRHYKIAPGSSIQYRAISKLYDKAKRDLS